MKTVMKTRAILTAVIAVAALAPGAALYAQQPSAEAKAAITTGYWKAETKILGLTIDTDFKCVSPADVDKFFTGPCNKGYTCAYPVRDVANGRARFEGTWTNRHGDVAHIGAEGTYSAKRFELNAHGTGTNGVPIAATLVSTWQGETCPADAKH